MSTTQSIDLVPNCTRRSVDEVMAEVSEHIPHLAQYMFKDRDWIWYCGPSLQGEHNKATREQLKLSGFRFAPGGHLMQDGVTKGSWSHSCLRPIARWHKAAAKRPSHCTQEPEQPARDYLKLFADLGL